MGHSVIMVKEALRPHAEYLVRAGFVVLAIDWRTAVSTATVGVAPREAGAASGQLNSSRQIGALLGLAALVTVAHNRTSQTAVPVALNDGYALGLTPQRRAPGRRRSYRPHRLAPEQPTSRAE
jgi:hypothetical protein